MSDAPTLVTLLHEQWRTFMDTIEQTDEKLGSADGPTAISRAAVASLPEGMEDNVVNTATRIFDGLDPASTAAVAYLLRKVLKSVDPTVKQYIDSNKTEVPELSEEESSSLREMRKEAVGNANALRVAVRTSAASWALENNENGVPNLDAMFPEQTNLRGGGKRASAPRLRGSWAWAVDGQALAGDTVKDLAKKIGVGPTELKLAIKAYMEQQNKEFDFADPPQSFTFEFTSGDSNDPDGHITYVINASRRESDEEEPEDDDSFDEPDEGDDLFSDD